MLLKSTSIMKLTGAALATFMYCTSYTLSAPVVLFADQATSPFSATVTNCVKVLSRPLLGSNTGNADNRPLKVLSGDRISMTVDASACDASRIDVTQPWTVFVMSHSNNQGSRVVFSDIIAPGRISEYTWVVQPAQYRAAIATDQSLGISITKEPPRPETEYYIRVQAVDKGKQSLLTGRSHTFVIGTALSKREDPPLPDLSAVGISTDSNNLSAMTEEPHLSVLESTTGRPEETSTPLLNAQGALGDSTGADLPVVPAAVVQEPAPLSVDPTGGLVDPTVPVAPITDAPVFPETPQDSPQESTPTYPNLPITVVEEVKKKQTPAEIFAKYAAAGAGILSTIGVGVGGVIGGLIGGTAGLVVGLLLAAVNASFYA